MMPYIIKKYTVDYGLKVSYSVGLLSENYRKNLDITETVFSNLMKRIDYAKQNYSKNTRVYINPSMKMLKSMAGECDAILGTNDFSLEELEIPVIHIRHEETGLSFESHVRNVKKIYQKIKQGQKHPHMLLNKMDFNSDDFPLLPKNDILAAREIWSKMWLHRKDF